MKMDVGMVGQPQVSLRLVGRQIIENDMDLLALV
jgi:hypothetical protein